MTENLLFNLRRIFEQILEDYRKIDNLGCIKKPRSRQDLLILTRQQLLLTRPRVVLSRIDEYNSTNFREMHSPQNSLKKLLENEEVENIKLSNMNDSVESNLMIIQKMIETIDHTIPFIDYSPNCQDDIEMMSDEVDQQKETLVTNAEQAGNKESNTDIETPVSKSLNQKESEMADLSTEAEILEMMESLIREENENISKMTESSSKNTASTTKNQPTTNQPTTTVRRGQRVRKPASYDFNVFKFSSSPEPAPKKKKKSKPTQVKTGTLKLNNNAVKVESRPMNSVERPEVEILFPSSLQDSNVKISLDLNKLDLPANISKGPKSNATTSNTKSKQKSKSKTKSKGATQEKSDLAKYLEYFSTNCDTPSQNISYAITSTNSESPHNTITTTTVDNLQDQISTTQIESTVSTFLTSNERGEWILTTEPIRGQIVTTSTPESLQRPQQQTSTTKSTTAVTSTDNTTQVDEDFIIPMDIENNAYRLVEFIENDNETFSTQQSTIAHQSTQSEFSAIPNPENVKNQRQPVARTTSLQSKSISSCKRDRPISKPNTSSSPCNEHKMFSKLDDNRVRAHASSCLYRSYAPIYEVLDLSMHKTRSETQDSADDVIDLSIRLDSYPFTPIEKVIQNQEVMVDGSLSGKNDIRKDKSTKSIEHTNKDLQNAEDRFVRKITLEEYKNRHKDLPENQLVNPVNMFDKDSNQEEVDSCKKSQPTPSSCKKKPQVCSTEKKALQFCRDMPSLSDDMDLDYEFDNSIKEPCVTPLVENARPTPDFSSVTKDSGIDSAECGNGNQKQVNSNSAKGNTTTFYADKGLESLLSDNEVDEDDALSIYAHSLLGSPLNISDTNDDNFRDICTPEFDQHIPFITSSPTKSTHRCSTEKPKFDPTMYPILPHPPGLTSEMTKYMSLPPPKRPDEVLKNFKIPKLKPAAAVAHSSTDTTTQMGINSINILDRFNFVTNNSNQQFKRTKSISPPNHSPSNRSSISVSSLPPESDLHNRKHVVCNIFGNPCFGFLAETCKKKNCKYTHRHLEAHVLKGRLMHLSTAMLESAYKFIWRNYRLFVLYFPTFCEIYGERGDKTRLVSMAKDCETYSDSLRFLKCVVRALTRAGLPHHGAVKIIMDNVRTKSIEVIDVLIELMLESDPLKFLGELESYSTHPFYRFKMDAINKMAKLCNHTKHFDLIQILLKIIIFHVSQEDLMNYKSEDITTFLVMVQSYHPAEKIQNVCSSYITNAKAGPSIFQTAPATTSTITRSNLPSITIPQHLGFKF